MLTDLQLELTQLIGSKELSFGCIIQEPNWWYTSKFVREIDNEDEEEFFVHDDIGNKFRFIYQRWFDWTIIGHPATLSDFHRWMNENNEPFQHAKDAIRLRFDNWYTVIPYDSSKDLLDQDTETLKQIINLICNNQ